MPTDAGIRFGQYVLVRRIARGGMAEVFLAQQRGLEGFDRRVAVKRILPHLADSQDFVKMFFGEARLAAQLSHPNIVHIYEFGKVEHDYFIAMEFVDGVHAGQLFKHGTEQEKLPATLVARIGADAANALHYAHELRNGNGQLLGLVHRDVSPANIMVSFDGVVKLCDFGIAKAAAANDHLTNPGQVKGKYAYMSPEQTIASQLDGRSDVFSLAIVMWELLSGKYIVPRGDAVAAMRAIRDGKLDPIEKVAPHVPAPLAGALGWALEPKRDKRATAAELAQALEAFLKSAPELTTSMQLGGWIRARFVREATGQMPAMNAPEGAIPAHIGTHVSAGTVVAPGTVVSPGTVVGPGTVVSPGTVVAPGTSAGSSAIRPVTPPAFPARRVVRRVNDTSDGTEIYSTADLDDQAQTIKGARPNKPGSQRAHHGDEPTVHERPPIGDATEVRHHAPAPDEEDSDLGGATIQRDMRAPPSRPSAMPTRMHAGLASSTHPPGHSHGRSRAHRTSESGMRSNDPGARPGSDFATRAHDPGARAHSELAARASDSGARPVSESAMRSVVPDAGARATGSDASGGMIADPRRRATPVPGELLRQRRKKMLLAIGGLAGLALLSFVIALAASSSKRNHAIAADDASVVALTPTAAEDAEVALAPPVDADVVAEPTVPVDAAVEPTGATVPPDAAVTAPVDDRMAYLVVRTIPDGGTVKVGNQTRLATVQPGDPTRVATARLLLPPGKHVVTAMLDGYRNEKRAVVLARGDHQRIEITFTKKIVHRPDRGPRMGRLTVRTTPWSDVYLGGKKLGQAPFADLELPAGTHTLTFKNPSRPTVTKTVTIRPGKSAKLNFDLP